jgi:dTDP-4-amino-4,6-dideoxygalactose transaminase
MSETFLPFAKPSISEAAIQEVVDCLRSGWITTGPRTQRFEVLLQEYLGAPKVLACSSATAGLFMALSSLKLEPGDEVITTAMTFVATLNTIVQAGGRPVLVDVEPHTYNMDVSQLEKAINPRTKAIVPVHFAGLPVDLDPLYALAKKHHLRVIEDAAHAIGTVYKGKKIGSFGDTQVFSFHPNKNMTTIEGGCIALQDESLLQHCKLLRFHGIDRDSWNRFSKEGKQDYDVVMPGYKFNFTDVQAALGIHQLAELDSFIEKRTALVSRYYEALAVSRLLALPQAPSYEHRHAWHLFAPRLRPECGLSRETFMEKLKAANIGTGLHYNAPHLYSYYQKAFGYREGSFPVAEAVGSQIVSLPLFPDMTVQDQDRVIQAIGEIEAMC